MNINIISSGKKTNKQNCQGSRQNDCQDIFNMFLRVKYKDYSMAQTMTEQKKHFQPLFTPRKIDGVTHKVNDKTINSQLQSTDFKECASYNENDVVGRWCRH